MLSLDTSAILALTNRRDPNHLKVRIALQSERPPYLVSFGIFSEVAYMLESRLGQRVLDAFLADLASGAFELDCGERDLPRIRQLVQRYADLPLGAADSAVVACAERHGGKVLTVDRRDFLVVAGEGKITILPD